MLNPLVSIIIPVYNAEKYLADCLRSALAQTWKNIEIIIVDDGSTDSSLQIAKNFASPKVKVYEQTNKGASAARNTGLTQAQGEYIQFLDADDLLSPDKIELQLNAIKNTPGCVAYGSHLSFFDNEYIDSKASGCYLNSDYTDGKSFLMDMYGSKDSQNTGGFIPQHSWLTPRRIIDTSGGWNAKLTIDDDGEFFCRVALNSAGIKFVENALCYYRRYRHKNNLSAQKTLLSWQSAFESIKLKQKHTGSEKSMNQLMANQAMHLLSTVYPKYPAFCSQITQFIDSMGGVTWLPYQEGPHKILRKLFGWKAVRLISYYKNYRVK